MRLSTDFACIDSSFGQCLDLLERPLFVGKLVRFEFRVNQLAVDFQFEAAASRGNQCERFDLLFERFEQQVRQTDGFRLVSSHGAVAKFNFHLGASD